MSLTTVVLAAGQGSRMKSDLPTALHPLAGRPLLRFVVDAARALEPLQLTVVVGFGGDRVRQKMGEGVTYASQGQPLGTGHALLQAEQAVAGRAASVLVLYGNRPLIRPETLRRVLDQHESEDAAITLLTCSLPDATGIYCFRDEWLWPNLRQLQAGPGGEYDLADLVERAGAQGELVTTLQLDDGLEAMAVDDRLRLAQAEAEMRRRINERWMLAGVTLIHPEATFIEAEVEMGADTTIWPNSFLQGQTRIGSACTIGPGSVIRDSTIGDGCKVELSVVEQAIIEEGSEVGPFGHLRKGAHLARGVHMGNFGEVKNSYLGPGVKMGHFSYLGDATVGDRTNIGAGTITCNYDGQRKHRTLIGQEAFIGSDTMLVAPVEIGDGAMTGAGSVVTRDVPPGSVAFGVPARVQSTPTSSPPPGETVESEVD